MRGTRWFTPNSADKNGGKAQYLRENNNTIVDPDLVQRNRARQKRDPARHWSGGTPAGLWKTKGTKQLKRNNKGDQAGVVRVGDRHVFANSVFSLDNI